MKLPGIRKTLLSGLISAALMGAPAWAKAPPAPLVPYQGGPNGPQADFPVMVGAPYQIGSTTFVPSDSMNFDSVGYAVVDLGGDSAISAAHHTLPVPSYAEVTDIKTGRTILVRINRRGPMDGSHAIELSRGAAAQLGVTPDSNTAVRVRRVNPPEAERALLRSGNPAPERMPTPKPLLDVLQRKLNPGLAQRTLDNGEDDAVSSPSRAVSASARAIAPAKVPSPKVATPKPAPTPRILPAAVAKALPPTSLPPAPLSLAPMPPTHMPPTAKPVETSTMVKVGASGMPPKGYVPSVAAPVGKVKTIAKGGKSGQTAAQTGAQTATSSKTDGEVSFHDAFDGDHATKAAKPEAAKKPAKPDVSAPRDAAKSTPAMTIQAGAFSDKARAQAVADKIGGSLSKVGAVWRVRAGPYTSHASAEAALAKVKSAGYSDARIQRAE